MLSVPLRATQSLSFSEGTVIAQAISSAMVCGLGLSVDGSLIALHSADHTTWSDFEIMGRRAGQIFQENMKTEPSEKQVANLVLIFWKEPFYIFQRGQK